MDCWRTDPWLRGQVPWDKIHVFWGDERHVPPTNAESNYRMAHGALLSKAPSHQPRVPDQERTPRLQARQRMTMRTRYESFFQVAAGELPRFDLVFLGPWARRPLPIVVSGHEGTP